MIIRCYVRDSTNLQNPELQKSMLSKWCEEQGYTPIFYVDINMTGKNNNRPELQRLLKEAQSGEIVAVTKLDRIARNMRDLKNILYDLEQKGVKFIAITQNIDTSNLYGRLLLNLLGSLAEFETDLTRERLMEGLQHAKANGVLLGRKRKINYEKVVQMKKQGMTIVTIAEKIGCSDTTVVNILKKHRAT